MSQVPPSPLRPLLSGAATAGLAMGFAALPATAQAQTANSSGAGSASVTTPDPAVLAPMSVSAQTPEAEPTNINSAKTGMSRLPATIKETPRVINVVPEEIIQQQRATTLEQVLKNVPGITMSAGEGQGGQTGDQFRIRGLTARGDIYTDGLKDFGVYTRDSFNTESVQVIKGPSGEGFGVGTSGGLINQTSKKAHLDNTNHLEQSIGTGAMYRTTLDSNHKITDTSAVRLNALYQSQDVADRNNIDAERKGFAADIGVGIGETTTWHLNYSYLKGEKTPDMGQPMMRGSDGIIRPAAEYGLKRSVSYARDQDHDETENHVLTSQLTHQASKSLSFYNDTRWSLYDRDLLTTNAGGDTPLTSLTGTMTYGGGGGSTYKQDGWGVQNVSGVKAEGQLFGLKHRAQAGLDLTYQESTMNLGTRVNGGATTTSVLNPATSYPANFSVTYPDSGVRSSSALGTGLFASDRVWMTEQVSVQGGLRWDYFRTSYRSQAAGFPNGQDQEGTWSPSVSLIYEPTEDISLYTTYSHSAKPVGSDLAALAITARAGSASETPSATRNFDPEETDLYEVGGKADFFGGRLGVNGAAFLLEKSNVYTVDTSTGALANGFSEAGIGTQITGIEAGVTGKITPAWTLYTGYAFLNGEVTANLGTPSDVGNDAPNVPKHNASIWTSYSLSDMIGDALPGELTLGGGAQYASKYWTNSANTAEIPETFSVDAMLSYEFENLSLALNGYNLTDHLNYTSAFNATRAVPASGRTVMLTAGVTF